MRKTFCAIVISVFTLVLVPISFASSAAADSYPVLEQFGETENDFANVARDIPFTDIRTCNVSESKPRQYLKHSVLGNNAPVAETWKSVPLEIGWRFV